MIVRSHLPWPLRWAATALMLGFSAALALWAFEFGKGLAGLDRNAQAELVTLREEVANLRAERERAVSMANTADSLIKAGRASEEKLVQQLREAAAENQALRADLGFFERLMPVASAGVHVRALQAESLVPGQLTFRSLVMQVGRIQGVFSGRYDVTLVGTQDGKTWSMSQPGGPKPLQFRQSLRLEGVVEYPSDAVVKTVQVKVLDGQGVVKTSQSVKL